MSLRAMTTSPLPLRTVVAFLEKFAPLELAEGWDNVGLLVAPQTLTPVRTALLTNDLTEDVVAEAVRLPAQLIVSYHPPIFKALKTISTATWKERVIGTCLENRIAIYSPHTTWDCMFGGVSDWLLSPFEKEDPAETVKGAGRVGTLREPLPLQDIVQRYKQLAKVSNVRLALARNATIDTLVQRIAVTAGSGASVLAGTSAELWVTGEMSHHELLDATHAGTSVLLLEHSNSERGFLTHFAATLRAEFPGLDVNVSKTDRDPIVIV